MANLEGMKIKFTVIKNKDIQYLNDYERSHLHMILDRISKCRKKDGKKDNTYLVINTDEPYADEVIEILKRHGHWG